MEGLVLKGYRVFELYYRNDIDSNAEIELTNNLSTRLETDAKTQQCQCFYNVTITETKNGLPLEARIRLVGIFSYPDGADSKELHVAAANELYPFARAILMGVTSNAGVPPFPMPRYYLNKNDIADVEK